MDTDRSVLACRQHDRQGKPARARARAEMDERDAELLRSVQGCGMTW